MIKKINKFVYQKVSNVISKNNYVTEIGPSKIFYRNFRKILSIKVLSNIK